MCGFTGFWDFKGNTADAVKVAEQMAITIAHRGPDATGLWRDANTQLVLAHTRLSIRDLSPEGSQPMLSRSQRWVITYNGEIYNAEELKADLVKLGYSFRGHSDTEVMVEAFDAWGVEQAVKRMIGMFAFALWDREEQVLYLVRDRLGIKPLYWGIVNDRLFFGSQIKSFLKHSAWQSEIDPSVLTTYFYLNYVPAPYSIFKGINKLNPGMVVRIDNKAQVTECPYWDFKTVATEGVQNRLQGSPQQLVNELDTLLKDAVQRRMVADVPLGAFLSGGIDSSTVVALMQAQSSRPIQTFSIGFTEADYNEAEHAKAVARHLGTEHRELYVSPQDAMDVIPSIPEWCDEPFADVSQIPTYLVSHLARQHVTVSLSGDGGDELFAGYNRYHLGHRIWKYLGCLPRSVRALASRALLKVPVGYYDRLAAMACGKLPKLFGDKCHKLASILNLDGPQAFYETLIHFWEHPEQLVLSGNLNDLEAWRQKAHHPFDNFIEQMQFMDTKTYLPDDILTKVDRASMAVSLEARVPLLDHRVVEFAWRLPLEVKLRHGQSKWILREVLKKYVPESLFNRPKMGFGVPIDGWLRGPLREWAEDLLSVASLSQSALNPAPIRQRWQEHLAGQRNWQYSLWGVLMFQQWRKIYL